MKSTIDLNTLAEKIHANAVEKGFWDVENQAGVFTLSRASQIENLSPKVEKAIRAGAADLEEKAFACMHAELSEAIQADRMGRPMLYYACICSNDEKLCRTDACEHYAGGHCKLADAAIKPEGVAVELADFVMRLLDWAAWKGLDLTYISSDVHLGFVHLANVVNSHHEDVCRLWNEVMSETYASHLASRTIMGVECWLKDQGQNLFNVIRMKREYNKTRPRLHGRKY